MLFRSTTTPYLLPGLVETWANPKAAHTILPTSGDLGDGTITAVTLALLDGMRCGGLTVTSDGTQGSCIQPASATLQNLSAADVGFFAEDDLPWPTAGASWWGPMAFAAIRGERLAASFEPPRSPMWRGPGH